MAQAALVQTCNLCHCAGAQVVITKDGFELARCGQCGLLYVRNPPSDEQRANLYSFEAGYHAELVSDPISTDFHAQEAQRNLHVLLPHASAGRLLDIGCSTGLFLKAAKERGWAGQGLEYSPDSSRIAREVHGMDVKTGELKAGTYPPSSFDIVTLWDVIEHVPDPAATLAQVSGILAAGGLLVMKTPNADGLYPRASLPFAKALGFWGHAEPPGHLYQFSVSTLTRLAEQAGFDVVAVQHQRIPLTYSFGPLRTWLRSLKWAVYCAAFVPLAWLGPFVRLGDDFVLVARKRPS
jgi:SAM-dependent methyltransferase